MKRRTFIKNTAATSALVTLSGVSLSSFTTVKERKITILHTNDVHSHIDPFPADDPRNANMGGVSRRAALIESIRKENPNVLLLDAGDIFQGTPYFNYYGGELEFKLMSNTNKMINIETTAPNIGALISRVYKEKRTYKSALARKLGVRPTTALNYAKKTSMQTTTLWKLSLILRHNFLKDLADQLPKEFSTYAPKDSSLANRIALLEQENELLKAQLAVLKDVMQK